MVTFFTLPTLWLRLAPSLGPELSVVAETFLRVELCTLLATVSVLLPSPKPLIICLLRIFSVEHFGIVMGSLSTSCLLRECLSRVLHCLCCLKLTESKLKSRE